MTFQRFTKLVLVVVAGLAVAACSTSEPIADSTTSTLSSASTTSTTSSTSTTTAQVFDPVTEEDLIRFVAATEYALRGTAQEGVVYDAPEIYVAIAQEACARFSDGEDFDQVAADLIADLSSAGLSNEDRLVGAILGAATQTICPEHAGKV